MLSPPTPSLRTSLRLLCDTAQPGLFMQWYHKGSRHQNYLRTTVPCTLIYGTPSIGFAHDHTFMVGNLLTWKDDICSHNPFCGFQRLMWFCEPISSSAMRRLYVAIAAYKYLER